MRVYSKKIQSLIILRYINGLFAICLLLSCNVSKNNKEISNFKEFYNKIPVIKLPLKIDCGLCGDTLFSDSIIKKYGHINSSFLGNSNPNVIGRIKNSKRIYILYSYPGDICYPFLFIYDEKGNILDSLYLQISTCDADENLELYSWSIIKPDLSIDMTDTEKDYYIDTLLNKRIQKVTYINKREYKLNSKGIPILYSHRRDSVINSKYNP